MSDHDSLEAFYRGCGDPACEEHRQPEPWKYPKEAPDGPDSPASGDSRGAAVPVGEPGRELVESAEDVLARIREVGATMQDAAARMEGAKK